MATAKILAASVLLLNVLGCTHDRLGGGTASVVTAAGVPKEAGGSLAIQKGAAVTPDPMLHLTLIAPFPGVNQMKIGFAPDCSDGSWQPFQSDVTIMSPVVNGDVLVSVQYKTTEFFVSSCYTQTIVHSNPDTPQICESSPEVCNRSPRVTSPGVVTMLLALGDEMNQQLVINGSSAEVMAEMAVSYASPLVDPKILVIRGALNQGESYQDTEYIAHTMLKLYSSVTLVEETSAGLSAADFTGYDLIWYNNPGYPMAYQKSRDALIAFKGSVVLSGDDLSWGNGFSMTPLTGLNFIDNGTSVRCAGVSYAHDNNSGYQYRVGLSSSALPGFPDSIMNFRYGNDIDNSTVAETSLVQVIAWAQGGPDTCVDKRPTIVTYPRPAQQSAF